MHRCGCAGGRSSLDSFGRGVGRVNVHFASGTGNRRFQRLKPVDDETGRLPSCLCSGQLGTLTEICSETLGLQIRLRQRKANRLRLGWPGLTNTHEGRSCPQAKAV